jgi:GntR family transcriptional regulator
MDLVKGKFTDADFKKNIFDFLEFKCSEKVIYNITQIIPMIAEGKIAQYMRLESGIPIIMFSEIGYNNSDKAVIHSKEYYVPDLIEMSIFRKKI